MFLNSHFEISRQLHNNLSQNTRNTLPLIAATKATKSESNIFMMHFNGKCSNYCSIVSDNGGLF